MGWLAGAGPAVVSYLRAKGIDDIDVLVACHPDSNHIGGLISVLQMADIPVETVVYNGYAGDTETWTNLMDAVGAEGMPPIVAQFPQTFDWGASGYTVGTDRLPRPRSHRQVPEGSPPAPALPARSPGWTLPEPTARQRRDEAAIRLLQAQAQLGKNTTPLRGPEKSYQDPPTVGNPHPREDGSSKERDCITKGQPAPERRPHR